MQQLADGGVEMVIADNGLGLPANLESKCSTVGMKLTRVLTEDINGIFRITSGRGTSISVIFQPTALFQPTGHRSL